MDVNYGEAVKRYLTSYTRLIRIHRFCPSDVQFADALVSSAIVVFSKNPPKPGHHVAFSFGGDLSKPQQEERVPLAALLSCRKWTSYPRRTRPANHEHPSTITLGDLFTIKRGLATGANDFFVLPRKEVRQRRIPEKFLRPILPSPRHLQQSIIQARSDGYPQIDHPLSLIDCDLPEQEVRGRYAALWTYLQQGKKRDIHKGYLASRRSPWYSQEKRPATAFMCTYMGRTIKGRKPFRFLWNKSSATAANVYLMLYPKANLRVAFAKDPWFYHVVFDFLQDITADMFLAEGRVYGGGLYKLEPKELARVSAEPIRRRITGIESHMQLSLFI